MTAGGVAPGLGERSGPADTLESAQAEIERLTTALERSNERVNEILYAAAHDFAEPLQIVLSYAELLASRYTGELDETGERFLAGIETGVNRIRALVDGMFAYSRLSRHPDELEDVDCVTVVNRALDTLAEQIEESGATVVADGLPTVKGDPVGLTRLFESLLDNAIKFRSVLRSPEIRVSAERRPEDWLFSIADNGIGIDSAQRDRIFDMFKRLHSREQYPGVGVGLAVCKLIVERHGGRIWVAGEPKAGSIFCFTIPAAQN